MAALEFDQLTSTARGFPIWPCFKANPLRPADWRWQAALRLAERDRVGWEHYDALVRLLCRGMRKLRRVQSQAELEHFWLQRAGMREAVELWLAGGWPRSELEAWLLTGAAVDTVAAKTRLSLATVEAYRSCFFDVVERSVSWVVTGAIAIHHERLSDESYLYRVVKLYAYQLGPLVLELLLELDIPNMDPLSIDDLWRHLEDPTDRRKLLRAALASKMLPLETPEQQLECLRFTLELYQHPLYGAAGSSSALDLTLADPPKEASPTVATAATA